MDLSNVEQHAVWNGVAGEHRLTNPDQDDAEVRALHPWLRSAAAIAPGERVLDVGCGTGQSTRDAGRAAAPGRVLGVDLSAGLLDRACRLTEDEGLDNVAYQQADAQVHRFEPESFDLAMSRFGVMFFADRVAAFRNLRRALRQGGRLALMVWQSRDRNQWASAIRDALTSDTDSDSSDAAPGAAPSEAVSPFSLADPQTVTSLLDEAGFADASLTDVCEPVYFGRDADAAYEFVRGLWSTGTALAGMVPDEARRASARLRATMVAHDTGHGVLFGARAWIISARRR